MIPHVPVDIRAEIVRLRGERLIYAEIARQTGVHSKIVRRICEEHYGNLVEQARVALKREINLARSEMHSAPLYHPERWG